MILVTGATGFVGKVLIKELLDQNFTVSALMRDKTHQLSGDIIRKHIVDLTSTFNALPILQDVELVIHVAGRAHIMKDGVDNSFEEFRNVNTDATLFFAKQAAKAGVKRFIFLSSIKVNGEMTLANQPFTEKDAFVPNDPYGLSKYKAEQGLLDLAKETGMEVVIIRPPLVYGPGVKANFALMMKWVHRGAPLPLGSVYNQRSFVAVDNLVSFIIHCVNHPRAANEVFLISDNEDISTTQLLRKVANAFGREAFLLAFPTNIMRFMAKLVGKEDLADRLFSSLQVDSTKARELLGWAPIVTMDEQLKKIADAYLNNEVV